MKIFKIAEWGKYQFIQPTPDADKQQMMNKTQATQYRSALNEIKEVIAIQDEILTKIATQLTPITGEVGIAKAINNAVGTAIKQSPPYLFLLQSQQISGQDNLTDKTQLATTERKIMETINAKPAIQPTQSPNETA